MKDRFHIEEKLLLQIATRSSLAVGKSDYKISMLSKTDTCVAQKDYVPFGKPQQARTINKVLDALELECSPNHIENKYDLEH